MIEKTGIPTDKVLVAVVRPTKKSGMSLAQEKLVKSYFLPTSERFYSEDVKINNKFVLFCVNLTRLHMELYFCIILKNKKKVNLFQ